MNSKSVALSLALFLAFVEVGTCLECFHCTSQSDPKCGASFTSAIKPIACTDPASTSFKQQNLFNILPADIFAGLPGAPKYCHKIVMKTGTVIRTCLDSSGANKDQVCKAMIENSKLDTLDKRVDTCTVCEKDQCNAAGSLSMSLPLSALTLVISYLLYKQ